MQDEPPSRSFFFTMIVLIFDFHKKKGTPYWQAMNEKLPPYKMRWVSMWKNSILRWWNTMFILIVHHMSKLFLFFFRSFGRIATFVKFVECIKKDLLWYTFHTFTPLISLCISYCWLHFQIELDIFMFPE